MTLDDATAARLVQVLERLAERLDAPAAPPAGERRLLTLGEACERLGCQRTRLFQLVRQQRLARVLVGQKARITLDSVEAYEDQLTAAPARKRGRPRKSDAQREAEAIARLKP